MTSSSVRLRSRTGCLTCKTRRKKCDETYPVCVRCRKSRIECLGYSYLEDSNQKAARMVSKATTRVASSTSIETPCSDDSSKPDRSLSYVTAVTANPVSTAAMDTPSSSSAQNSLLPRFLDVPQENLLSATDEHLQGLLSGFMPNGTDANADVFDFSLLSPRQTGMLIDPRLGGEARGEHIYSAAIFVDDPNSAQGMPGPSNLSFSAPIDRPSLGDPFTLHVGPILTTDRSSEMSSGQASLFNALWSLGQTTDEHSQSTPAFDSDIVAPGNSQGSAWLSPDEADYEDSTTDEERDPEGIKEIICGTLALDKAVKSNSFSFVLQSYARWIIQTVFEPLRVAHQTKDWVAKRYAQSEDSRIGIMLFAGLLDAVWKKGAAAADYLPVALTVTERIRHRVAQATSELALTTQTHAERATTMDEVLEMLDVQCQTTSVISILKLLTESAPLFRHTCPEPPDGTIDLASIFVHPNVSLRRFAVMDIVMATCLSRPMLFRYNVCYDREFCNGIFVVEHMGLQWLNGIPDQIVLILARMNMLRDDFAPNVDPGVADEIAQELREFTSVPPATTDAYLQVARFAIQEFWRLAMSIYLYMGLCGADAKDPRVAKAQKSFMRLFEGTKPGRTPDSFLIMPIVLAGVATHREREQRLIRQRMLSLRECANPGSAGHDGVRMLEDIWARTSVERRPAVWGDLRVSCARIMGA